MPNQSLKPNEQNILLNTLTVETKVEYSSDTISLLISMPQVKLSSVVEGFFDNPLNLPVYDYKLSPEWKIKIGFSHQMLYSSNKDQIASSIEYYVDGYPHPLLSAKSIADRVMALAYPQEYNASSEGYYFGPSNKVTKPIYYGDYMMKPLPEANEWSTGHDMTEAIPALLAMVKHPVHGDMVSLKSAIINLNDMVKWSREQIADWLDTLDLDLQFKVETEN